MLSRLQLSSYEFIYFAFVFGAEIIFLPLSFGSAHVMRASDQSVRSVMCRFSRLTPNDTNRTTGHWINYSDNQIGHSEGNKNQPSFNYLFGFILFYYLIYRLLFSK